MSEIWKRSLRKLLLYAAILGGAYLLLGLILWIGLAKGEKIDLMIPMFAVMVSPIFIVPALFDVFHLDSRHRQFRFSLPETAGRIYWQNFGWILAAVLLFNIFPLLLFYLFFGTKEGWIWIICIEISAILPLLIPALTAKNHRDFLFGILYCALIFMALLPGTCIFMIGKSYHLSGFLLFTAWCAFVLLSLIGWHFFCRYRRFGDGGGWKFLLKCWLGTLALSLTIYSVCWIGVTWQLRQACDKWEQELGVPIYWSLDEYPAPQTVEPGTLAEKIVQGSRYPEILRHCDLPAGKLPADFWIAGEPHDGMIYSASRDKAELILQMGEKLIYAEPDLPKMRARLEEYFQLAEKIRECDPIAFGTYSLFWIYYPDKEPIGASKKELLEFYRNYHQIGSEMMQRRMTFPIPAAMNLGLPLNFPVERSFLPGWNIKNQFLSLQLLTDPQMGPTKPAREPFPYLRKWKKAMYHYIGKQNDAILIALQYRTYQLEQGKSPETIADLVELPEALRNNYRITVKNQKLVVSDKKTNIAIHYRKELK